MKSRKAMTHGQMVASNVMNYLNTMYPDIMKQSRSFRTSLKNYMASQIDMKFSELAVNGMRPRQLRSPIEMMIDQACGITEVPKDKGVTR